MIKTKINNKTSKLNKLKNKIKMKLIINKFQKFKSKINYKNKLIKIYLHKISKNSN
jgi:hypothetical protein